MNLDVFISMVYVHLERSSWRIPSGRPFSEATMSQRKASRLPSPKRQVARFLAIFLGLWAALWAIPYVLGRLPFGVQKLCPVTASWLGGLLSLLGFTTSVNGTYVHFGLAGLEIIAECTGYTAMALFFSVVIAYPSPIRKKLIGLAVGIPLILAFNLFRLVVMAFILAYRPQYFDFAHLYFWQVALIIFVVAMVVLWIQKLVNREKPVAVST